MTKTEKIILDAVKEVHEILGGGHGENVYELALAHELRLRGIPYERQKNFDVLYKGYLVGQARTDIIVNPRSSGARGEEILLELKRGETVQDAHIRQARVYLASLNIPKGFVFAFGGEEMTDDAIERVRKPSLSRISYEVQKPRNGKKEKLHLSLLRKIANEVYEYFGPDFFKIGGDPYTNAIAVELTLMGISHYSHTGDLLYKHCPVLPITYPIVLEDRTPIIVTSYPTNDEDRLEEKIQEILETERYHLDQLGMERAFIIAFPTVEGKKPIVREIP